MPTPIKEGKVREIYDNGDSLIMVATDRISCFDVILSNTVPKKGEVLTQMSKFWFELTSDIIPNMENESIIDAFKSGADEFLYDKMTSGDAAAKILEDIQTVIAGQ